MLEGMRYPLPLALLRACSTAHAFEWRQRTTTQISRGPTKQMRNLRHSKTGKVTSNTKE